MTHAATHAARSELPRALYDEHASLERAFHDVLLSATLDDGEGLRSAFHALDVELREHLALEERALLPRFEHSHPQATNHVRREHELIRKALDELGIALDLHALRAHHVEAFIAILREHAEREDRELYRWAGDSLPREEQWPLVRWVAARLHERLSRGRDGTPKQVRHTA